MKAAMCPHCGSPVESTRQVAATGSHLTAPEVPSIRVHSMPARVVNSCSPKNPSLISHLKSFLIECDGLDYGEAGGLIGMWIGVAIGVAIAVLGINRPVPVLGWLIESNAVSWLAGIITVIVLLGGIASAAENMGCVLTIVVCIVLGPIVFAIIGGVGIVAFHVIKAILVCGAISGLAGASTGIFIAAIRNHSTTVQ